MAGSAAIRVDAWCADFTGHAPGGGEPLARLLQRAADWHTTCLVVVVADAGWMLARGWLQDAHAEPPTAAEWPRAPRHGELRRLAGGRRRPPWLA